MKKRPFREHHLLMMMQDYCLEKGPLDGWMADYFRANKALGSHDKAYVSDTAYTLVRWKGLLEHFSKGDSWEALFDVYQTSGVDVYSEDEKIPLHLRASFPRWLFEKLTACFGENRAWELCFISNERAPTTVRVNALKSSRDDLLKSWSGKYDVSPCKEAPFGIVFNKKINLFGMDEFKEGLFEVQDEGSQLLAALVKAKPGDLVLDYCAGAGGKALAIAPEMRQGGQLYLHDIRAHALQDAKKRLRRAGVFNSQLLLSDSPNIKKLKKKMDWVLVDAPCSGTGTLRRHPEMKWRFNEENLISLIGQQRMIFERALSFLKPGGCIVYGTCSLLEEENEQQVRHFLDVYDLELAEPFFQSLPESGGMDGFFGAILRRRTA